MPGDWCAACRCARCGSPAMGTGRRSPGRSPPIRAPVGSGGCFACGTSNRRRRVGRLCRPWWGNANRRRRPPKGNDGGGGGGRSCRDGAAVRRGRRGLREWRCARPKTESNYNRKNEKIIYITYYKKKRVKNKWGEK